MRGEQYFKKRLIEEAEQKRVSTVWFGVLIRLVIVATLMTIGIKTCDYAVDKYLSWENNPMLQ
jgi:hypothetical protein